MDEAENERAAVVAQRGEFPGGAPDRETFELMERLNDLQTWTVLMATRGAPKAREAMDLVQETRAFIVERTYPGAMAAKAARGDHREKQR